NAKFASSSLTIDGNPADWNLPDLSTVSRGGQNETGDYALIGYSGATAYSAGHFTGGQYPPTNQADHTARVWSRHDATYQYFLARIDDGEIRTPNPVATNWANDCIEFFIDPGFQRRGTALVDPAETSYVQLDIDAANQKNVYMCTPAYAATVL